MKIEFLNIDTDYPDVTLPIQGSRLNGANWIDLIIDGQTHTVPRLLVQIDGHTATLPRWLVRDLKGGDAIES